LALMPGLPFIPFATFAVLSGWLAWTMSKKAEEASASERIRAAEENARAASAEEPLSNTVALDAIRIELGYGLLPIINESRAEPRLDDQVRALRRQMASDYGFVLPSVRIIDNMALRPNEYVVYIKE